MTPTYPGFGNPCNKCGLCCLAEQCEISLDFFGKQEICPALKKVADGYNCDLMVDPVKYVLQSDPAKISRWIPPVGWQFEEVWQAHLRFLFGPQVCDSEIEEEENAVQHQQLRQDQAHRQRARIFA